MPRVLVVGCGGLGGVVASSLIEHAEHAGNVDAPVEVTALTTNQAVVDAVREHGFRVRGVDGARDVAGTRAGLPVVLRELGPSDGPYDWVVLATQPPEVETAARKVLPRLADHGAFLCLQNGLCEERVAAIAGRERVVGAVVAWGGAMLEPGVFERTSAGGFTLGALDETNDARTSSLAGLATLLEPIGPVAITRNLTGARWSKLAINCAISTLGTLGGKRLGALMISRLVRRLALELMTEVVHVARAERVRLEKVSGTLDLEWIALTEAERRAAGSPGLVAKHSMLLAVGARYRRMRSSMLAAVERGRPPAVDFLNGEVELRGRKHLIPTPYNAEASRLVHHIARGGDKPGMHMIERLARNVDAAALERDVARSA